MHFLPYIIVTAAINPLTMPAPAGTNSHEQKSVSYFDFLNPEEYNYEVDDNNYITMAIEENDVSRTIPKRKPVQPNTYNSPIYYIRLPPQPYIFVPGLGYISQSPSSPVSEFVNLPVSFVANGKPSTIYQWAGNLNNFPSTGSTILPQNPIRPQSPNHSIIHKLPGQYAFNGKPDDIFVLRDSYNSLYGDALQNFYP